MSRVHSQGPVAILALSLFALSPSTTFASQKEPVLLCPSSPRWEQWELSEPLEPALTDMEKRLVCGDLEKKSESPNEGWRSIPRPQGRFNLQNFLEARGYLHPKFVSTPGSDVVKVILGAKTRVTSLSARGEPEGFDLGRKRKVVGEALTPNLLDGIEKWARSRLGALGYACGAVESRAGAEDGRVELDLKPGQALHVLSVEEARTPEVAPGVFRRYDAFEIGNLYDGELTTLTENRMISDQLVLSTHFSPRCAPDGVHLKQELVLGPPRLVSVGFGVNTEGIFTARGTWRNLRLDENASDSSVSLQISQPLQTLTGWLRWFPRPGRFAWKPQLELRHENEVSFESSSFNARFDAITSRDHGAFAWTYSLGPTAEFYRTLRGQGAPNSRIVSLEGRVSARTHTYEYFATSPRAGMQTALTAQLANPAIFSDIVANRLRLEGEGLWNIRNFDPPLVVIGLRGAATTILTPERPGPGTLLPVGFLEFLGGSQDLRGFGRKELPPGGSGALTSAFLDFEVRLANTFPAGIEPFLFFDAGKLGFAPLSFDPGTYWDPGFGIRWASPIGVMRGTVAQGFYPDMTNKTQFYFSYGEEF